MGTMITMREVAVALFGATRLAKGDAHGLDFFDDTVEAFWRSFWAAAVVAPPYLLLLAIELSGVPIHSGPMRVVLVEAVAYVIGWTAFPVAMFYLCEAIGRQDRYIRYIVAANWATVLQVSLYLLVSAVIAIGILPGALALAASLATHLALAVYAWFIARVGLLVSPAGAAGIVALDIAISLALNGVVRAML
jgi:hypothetical protein